MSVDTIGNFLTVIRNGLMVGKRSVTIQHSNIKEEITKVLKEEGFVKDFKTTQKDNKTFLTVSLKYVSGEAVIHEITRISTPGRRHFERLNSITPVIGDLGISILTTSRGVLSHRDAKRLSVGGEVICHVW